MAKTIEEGFSKFISGLKPNYSEHWKAASHKNSVEACLYNNFGCYRFFETGSFGNGTSVKHFSDTDYFAAIPKDRLWENSSSSLAKVREALQTTFPRTEGIKVNCPAVKIPFGQYASEDMEITPCWAAGTIDTKLGNFALYQIPNCDGGWVYSSPKAHNEYVKKENDRLRNSKVKNLIQLVKAWKYFNEVPISSFYLELRVTKYVETENIIVFDTDLQRIFVNLYNQGLADMRDPMGVSGLISASKTENFKKTALSKLNTAATRAEKAIEAKSKDNIDDSFYWWNLLFDNKFPSR